MRNSQCRLWNSVLVPKFVRWRHILVDGLTLHSAKVFPLLAVREGDKVVDAGCALAATLAAWAATGEPIRNKVRARLLALKSRCRAPSSYRQ